MKPSTIGNLGPLEGRVKRRGLPDASLVRGEVHVYARPRATYRMPRGIPVNAVAPGAVWTPLNPSLKQAQDVSKFGADTPLKRPAKRRQIAPDYVFLTSPHCAGYITGENLADYRRL